MSDNVAFEKYPFKTVLVSNLVSILIYAAGAFILYQVHIVVFILFILLVLWLEFRLLFNSCKNCWYFGKRCAFGKGKMACLVTKKGDTTRFSERQANWLSVLPDILVTAVPVIAAIVLMVIDYRWLLLISMLLIIALSTTGNGFIRGKLACRYCKQRELGCPAEKLFSKTDNEQEPAGTD